MAAGKHDILIEQGASFYEKLTFKDNASPPVAIDLTGNTFAGKLRKNVGDSEVIATFTCTVLNQTTNRGEVEITLTDLQTAAIPLRPQSSADRVTEDFCYDYERTFTDGHKERVLQGLAKVSPEVTR